MPTAPSSWPMVRNAALALVFALLFAAQAPAQAQGSNSVYSQGTALPFTPQSNTGASISSGTPGPINLGTWSGDGYYAAAAGSTQTLRSMAVATGGSNSGSLVTSGSAFDWNVTVGGGTSGLAIGAPVQLTLGLKVDGRLAAGDGLAFGSLCIGCGLVLPAEYGMVGIASADLRYDLYDTNLAGYEDGSPDFRFEYGACLTYSGFKDSHTPATVVEIFESVARADLQGGAAWNWAGNQPYAETSFSGIPTGSLIANVNTGLLLFTFDTFVGHTLRMDASLVAEVSGAAQNAFSWKALSDFGNTFDVDLFSSVAGLEFSNYTPGVYAQPVAASVPEPQTGALMVAGMAAMGIAARRRNRSVAQVAP